MSASPRIRCEKCNATCKRLLGTGAGIIFKGSGFYETDFKKKRGAPPETAKASGDGGTKAAPAKSGDTAAKSTSTAKATAGE